MGMYSHPWTPALLGLTHILEDLGSRNPDVAKPAKEALYAEDIAVNDVAKLVCALESICDCSFRG